MKRLLFENNKFAEMYLKAKYRNMRGACFGRLAGEWMGKRATGARHRSVMSDVDAPLVVAGGQYDGDFVAMRRPCLILFQ